MGFTNNLNNFLFLSYDALLIKCLLFSKLKKINSSFLFQNLSCQNEKIVLFQYFIIQSLHSFLK